MHTFTSWASQPLQAIAKDHLVGNQAGMQSGDFLYSFLNKMCAIQGTYFIGQSLTTVRKQFREFILKMQRDNVQISRDLLMMYHLQAVVLQEGEQRLDEECVDDIPGLKTSMKGVEEVIKKGVKLDTSVPLLIKIFRIQRACFFRRFDDISFGNSNISDVISEEKQFLRPGLLMGIFFEGLAAFQLARQSSHEIKTKWIECGESALAKMTCWANHCQWNFENKMLLLQAEKMDILGKFDQAADCYIRSIRSAHDHKFNHEKAIASELAGDFFYKSRVLSKSLALFKHSITCYKEWGAFSVARRVESSVRSKFGLTTVQIDVLDDSLPFVFALHQGPSKKRLGI